MIVHNVNNTCIHIIIYAKTIKVISNTPACMINNKKKSTHRRQVSLLGDLSNQTRSNLITQHKLAHAALEQLLHKRTNNGSETTNH